MYHWAGLYLTAFLCGFGANSLWRLFLFYHSRDAN
jgi:hypothetical protein